MVYGLEVPEVEVEVVGMEISRLGDMVGLLLSELYERCRRAVEEFGGGILRCLEEVWFHN